MVLTSDAKHDATWTERRQNRLEDGVGQATGRRLAGSGSVKVMSGVNGRTVRRSVVAVGAGFATTAMLSIGVDAVMHGVGFFPPIGQRMSDAMFVWATAYRVLFTILGGYVAAGLAPHAPIRHALWLGAVGTLAAVIGAVATLNRGPEFGPAWFPISLVITAMPCVWVGAYIAQLHHSGTRSSSQVAERNP